MNAKKMHKYCCICFSTKNLTTVPEDARNQCYMKKRIYIPVGNRCCKNHIIKTRIYEEDLSLLKVHSNTATLTAVELSQMMETLSIKSDSSLFDKVGEFSLSEKQIKIFTGLNWENIIQIKDMFTSLRNTESRSVIQALVVFLFKLRTASSNAIMASILQLENEHKVSEYSNSIIKSFEIDVLPFNFGLSCFNRNDLIENCTTEMAKKNL